MPSETADLWEYGWAAANTGLLATLTIEPSVFFGGESTRGTIYLHDPAPAGGMMVAVTADDNAVTVPASVTVAAGATTATCTITTRTVSSDLRILITASVSGSSLTALMRITPVIAVKSLTVPDTNFVGGHSTTATVTLNAENTRGTTVVALESKNGDARVPASMTIASGSTTGGFVIETGGVSNDTEVRIHARVGTTQSQSVQLRLLPPGRSAAQGTITIGATID